MTSTTQAWALCRLFDNRSFQCRACGTTASTRCGGLSAIGRARAWLAATWLESGWLTPRSTTHPSRFPAAVCFSSQFSNELSLVSLHLHMFASHCLLFVTPPLICLLLYLGPVALGITSWQVTSNCPAQLEGTSPQVDNRGGVGVRGKLGGSSSSGEAERASGVRIPVQRDSLLA